MLEEEEEEEEKEKGGGGQTFLISSVYISRGSGVSGE